MASTHYPFSISRARELVSPSTRTLSIPRLTTLVAAAVIATGAASTASAASTADGEALFGSNCVACHQATGAGIPNLFPPLDGSEWVAMDARVISNILLHGIDGEITVKGATYKGMMPSFGDKFSDDEIAAIATYVRSAWSNTSGPVDASLVAAERKAGSRTTPFAGGAELKELAGKP